MDCNHHWLPVEKMKAVYRCPHCKVMGYKPGARTDIGGNWIVPYVCSVQGCKEPAVVLMTRRKVASCKRMEPLCAEHRACRMQA